MLKQVSHILISLVLLVATTGLTIEKHYCGNSLVSISLPGDAKPCCDMDGNCCHEETDAYKLTVDYTNPEFTLCFEQPPYEIPAPLMVFTPLPSAGFSDILPFGLSPPPSPRTILSVLQAYRL